MDKAIGIFAMFCFLKCGYDGYSNKNTVEAERAPEPTGLVDLDITRKEVYEGKDTFVVYIYERTPIAVEKK